VADQPARRDLLAAAFTTMFISFSFGAAAVALPLVALRAGYDGTQIGMLTGCNALAAMAVRPALAWAMRVVPDRTLVTAALILIAMSSGLVVLSVAWLPLVAAELLQGASRSFFWTGMQTHVVRGTGPSAHALARVNLVSSLGMLAGPIVAGALLEEDSVPALAVVAAVALLAVPIVYGMDRLPPFSRPADRPPGRIWRRPGVDAGCWAGATAGGWRALVGSYVLVALERAGQSSRTIGVLVSGANGASVIGAVLVSRVPARRMAAVFASATLAAGLGIALCAAVAASAPMAALALAVSGLGAGALQTVGPVLATDAVHPEERGEAIAAAGMFRAGVGFAAPLIVAGLIAVIPLTAAMALVGATVAAPSLLSRRLVRARPLSASGGPVP
jgi:MFS family permease